MRALQSSTYLMCAVITTAAVLAMLVADARKERTIRGAMKTVAVVGFIGAALVFGVPTDPTGITTLVALVLCGLGDVLLIPAGAKRAFLLGLVSFLIGHVGFAIAFVTRGVAWSASALSLLLLLPVIFFVMRWLLPHVERKMKLPVIVYVGVITLMVCAAVGSVAAGGPVIGLVAALAFFFSDFSVARERFVSDTFLNKLWGVPLYFGAQLAFAAWMLR